MGDISPRPSKSTPLTFNKCVILWLIQIVSHFRFRDKSKVIQKVRNQTLKRYSGLCRSIWTVCKIWHSLRSALKNYTWLIAGNKNKIIVRSVLIHLDATAYHEGYQRQNWYCLGPLLYMETPGIAIGEMLQQISDSFRSQGKNVTYDSCDGYYGKPIDTKKLPTNTKKNPYNIFSWVITKKR